MSQPASAASLSLEDPHHEHDHDHGHTIVSWKVLVGVLAILLVFTAMTVSAAQAEKWIATTFDVILPDWANVAVAMSIATIKGILVMMFFMQLKYDNPFNTIIMLFCFLAFSLFLGFTALDLTNRAWVDPWKMRQISAGGTGMEGTPLVWQARINVATRRNALLRENEAAMRSQMGNDVYDAELLELSYIMDRAGIEKYIAEHGMEHYFERLAHYDPRAAGHAVHATHAPGTTGSSAERSRPRTGLSGALSTSSDEHASGHPSAEHEAAGTESGTHDAPTSGTPEHATPALPTTEPAPAAGHEEPAPAPH